MGRKLSPRHRHQRHRRGGIRQSPFAQLQNPHPPVEILSADQLESIHRASLEVLENTGMNFLLPEAREILRRAGAEVDKSGARVRFDRALVEQAMASAPPVFTMRARNPAHDLIFGGSHINFSTVGSPPNATDLERGRRSGNRADFCDFLKLTQCINAAQFTSGHPVEPVDIPPAVRHLEATLAMVELTDKIFRIYSLGRQRVLDNLAMTRMVFGVDDAGLAQEPRVYTVVNANSPLQYDAPMLWGMMELAARRQPVVVTPFTLAGAMAPVTLAGALAQQNAEALAGMAFVQLVEPGAPVMYGGFTSNVDMKTGSPAFGTPEYAKAALIGAQLARRCRVPFRSSNVNASNAPDAQAVYESQMSLWAAVMGHANFVHHALGWLEGGLSASFEKFILDAEMIQMMAEFLKPVEVNPAELALEAIEDVGPGGHFFATAHTLERYEHAFYQPLVSDWRNFETWSEDGAADATRRAHRLYKRLLKEYRQPPLDPAVREELHEFVARRKAEGGAPVQ
ncbi:MAG: trimethylamine methyltransferase family protein [Gammaproteobacteria bacterium]|nr:trimethylamine methyltransferase family protein [Gammaproteobacteria bacterium]